MEANVSNTSACFVESAIMISIQHLEGVGCTIRLNIDSYSFWVGLDVLIKYIDLADLDPSNKTNI